MDTIIKESEITPEQNHLLRFGHAPIPFETDNVPPVFKQIAEESRKIFNDIVLKTEKDIEKLLKAGMFLLQDYNSKHYNIIRKEVDAPREDDDIFRHIVEVRIEHKKSSRNGHRRNHPLSKLFIEHAIELSPKLMQWNFTLIHLGAFKVKRTAKDYYRYPLEKMRRIARVIGVE